MMISPLHTHETVKNLTAAGFTAAQAEAVTAALKAAVDLDLSNLATKSDLAVLRGEFRGKIGTLRGELEAKIEATKADLIKWVVGMGFAEVALLRLVPGVHP